MNGFGRGHVKGVLGPHGEGFRAELLSRGYTPRPHVLACVVIQSEFSPVPSSSSPASSTWAIVQRWSIRSAAAFLGSTFGSDLVDVSENAP